MAKQIKGLKHCFTEISLSIDRKSAIPFEICLNLTLHRLYVNRLFRTNSGIEISAKETSLDTKILQIKKRMGDQHFWFTNLKMFSCLLY